MTLTIKVASSDGHIRAQACGIGYTSMVYSRRYHRGDKIVIESDYPGYVVLQAEDSIPPTFGYLRSPFTLPIPFGTDRYCYSPKSFTGKRHRITARIATTEEVAYRRNLALNPLDNHDNTGFFPHATANVETRDEAAFAARNAIDGIRENRGHGKWPYQSWGINKRNDAELRINFGRQVLLDEVVITLRADFPHDNWWRTATLRFSDGSNYSPALKKTDAPQRFPLGRRTVEWLTMGDLVQDETDPSPFPALTQIELWGIEIV